MSTTPRAANRGTTTNGAKTGRRGATRAAPPLSDGQLLDLERLSEIADRKGWYSFERKPDGSIKVTLPFSGRIASGSRETAKPSKEPSATPAKIPNARQRASRARLQDYQQHKRGERTADKSDAAEALSSVRTKSLPAQPIEKERSPSSTCEAGPAMGETTAPVPNALVPSSSPALAAPLVAAIEPEPLRGRKRDAASPLQGPPAVTQGGSCERQRGKVGRGGGLLRKPHRVDGSGGFPEFVCGYFRDNGHFTV